MSVAANTRPKSSHALTITCFMRYGPSFSTCAPAAITTSAPGTWSAA